MVGPSSVMEQLNMAKFSVEVYAVFNLKIPGLELIWYFYVLHNNYMKVAQPKMYCCSRLWPAARLFCLPPVFDRWACLALCVAKKIYISAFFGLTFWIHLYSIQRNRYPENVSRPQNSFTTRCFEHDCCWQFCSDFFANVTLHYLPAGSFIEEWYFRDKINNNNQQANEELMSKISNW